MDTPFGSNAYTAENYATGYPDGIENHYWNHARNVLLAAELKRLGASGERILEIGCGRGFVVEYLRKAGMDCFGSEIAPAPVVEGIREFVFCPQDAFALPDAFRASVRVVLLLDVIEHIEDAPGFLRKIREAYPALRWLLVMVPARQEIWSNHDQHFGHFRRYDLENLSQHLSQGGFTTESRSYLFHSLYWAARLLLGSGKKRDVNLKAPSKVLRPVHRLIARILLGESRLLPRGWAGSSAIALARPSDTQRAGQS